jgi:hypothetical protein
MTDLPIACRLQPGELKQRGDDLLPGVARMATTCVPAAHWQRRRHGLSALRFMSFLRQ